MEMYPDINEITKIIVSISYKITFYCMIHIVKTQICSLSVTLYHTVPGQHLCSVSRHDASLHIVACRRTVLILELL